MEEQLEESSSDDSEDEIRVYAEANISLASLRPESSESSESSSSEEQDENKTNEEISQDACKKEIDEYLELDRKNAIEMNESDKILLKDVCQEDFSFENYEEEPNNPLEESHEETDDIVSHQESHERFHGSNDDYTPSDVEDNNAKIPSEDSDYMQSEEEDNCDDDSVWSGDASVVDSDSSDEDVLTNDDFELIRDAEMEQENVPLPELSFDLNDSEEPGKNNSKADDPDYINSSGQLSPSAVSTPEDSSRKRKRSNIENYIPLSEEKFNYEGMSAPDLATLKVSTVNSIPRGKRKLRSHKCPYCPFSFVHLKVHLQRVHGHREEVQIMLRETKLNPGSRKPMETLLSHGDLQYNTNSELNKGDLRVARLPKLEHSADDYIPCKRCKKTILVSSYRKHRQRCTGENSLHTRNVAFEGKAMWPTCSASAKNRMRQRIIPTLRKDLVRAAIVRDELIIRFGNELCNQLRGVQHEKNIITKLRRLGRLKVKLGLKNLIDMYILDSEDVVKAIESFAVPINEGEFQEFYEKPTVARNFQTLVKEVTESLIAMCIKNIFKLKVETVENWQKTFLRDFHVIVSRAAGESKKRNARLNDKEEVPEEGDIELLYKYLSKNLRESFIDLKTKEYNLTTHLKFLKLTLVYLQVINRRRPGDVERIYIEELAMMKSTSDESARLFGQLDPEEQDVAKEYSVLRTRGKLNRDLKLLISSELKMYLTLVKTLREKFDIPKNNHYLFALPRNPRHPIRYPSAYVLMKRFSKACGAKRPELLRATNLRKDLAKRCILLNLADDQLRELADFMGHELHIHMSVYRKNILQKQVPSFLQFLDAATSNFKGNATNETSQESFANTCSENDDDDVARNQPPPRAKKNSAASTSKEEKVARIRWTQKEKETVFKTFPAYMSRSSEDIPGREAITAMIEKNPEVFHASRTLDGIKIWCVQNRKKKSARH